MFSIVCSVWKKWKLQKIKKNKKIKIKIKFSSLRHRWSLPSLAILFGPFWFSYSRRLFNYLVFSLLNFNLKNHNISQSELVFVYHVTKHLLSVSYFHEAHYENTAPQYKLDFPKNIKYNRNSFYLWMRNSLQTDCCFS